MPVLSIVRGLPASGKSTFAKTLHCLHVEADMFFMVNGSYRYDPKKVEEAHRWCQETVRYALSTGLDVVVSNTFTRAWEIEDYLRIASSDVKVDIYRMTGNHSGLHNVPTEVVEAMRLRFEIIAGEVLVAPYKLKVGDYGYGF